MLVHKQGEVKQRRQACDFTPNRDSVAGKVGDAFYSIYIQHSNSAVPKRTNWMHVIWAMWRFCALLIIVSLQHCVSGEQVPKHALSHIFQVSVTITATERMAGAFCLSLVVPTKWSQLQYQLNGPSEHSPGKRHNYHLAASTLRQPSETLSAPVELFNVRGKFTSNNLSHLIEKFLSIDQTPMF